MKKTNLIILILFFTITISSFCEELNINGTYDVYGTNPDGTLYNGTVQISTSGQTYSFTWQVGDSYKGSGILSGNILTVDWGADAPVIYIVTDGGNALIGTWANHSATETLSKQKYNYKEDFIDGTYSLQGTNPDGKIYSGTVSITYLDGEYIFSWAVPETYSGSGTVKEDKLTINWGGEYPVIYEILLGGKMLAGTWANGTATEILYK